MPMRSCVDKRPVLDSAVPGLSSFLPFGFLYADLLMLRTTGDDGAETASACSLYFGLERMGELVWILRRRSEGGCSPNICVKFRNQKIALILISCPMTDLLHFDCSLHLESALLVVQILLLTLDI